MKNNSRNTRKSLKIKINIQDSNYEHLTPWFGPLCSDESLTEMCSWIYLPTRRTPKFPLNSARNQVEAWVILEGYETALDRQTEDAKEVKITKCETDRS